LDLAQLKGVGFDNGLNSKATDLECERILGTPTLRYPNTEGWFFGGAIAYRTNGFRTDLNFRSIAAPKPVGSKKVLSMISVASRDAQVPVQTVTFAKLLNNPERYDYLRVKVEGYLKSHGDLAALYENKVQADVPRKDYVWIAPTVTVDHEKDVQSIKEGKVRVIGVVDCGLRSLEFGVGRSNHWDISISELELLEEVKE
jgi:hypothetical protein